MCACNGTGGIQIEHSWGVQFHPCPDSNCQFDRTEHERNYNEWKQRVINELGDIFTERRKEVV